MEILLLGIGLLLGGIIGHGLKKEKRTTYCRGGQHDFQPRYSTEESMPPCEVTRMSADSIAKLKHVKNTYIHDVCESCGEIVGRNDA